jgi:hypothetical protein
VALGVLIATISGALIAWRAFAGPVLIHSPLNAEGVFGVTVVLLLLFRARAEAGGSQPLPLDSKQGVAMLAIAAITIAAFWRTLGSYFLSDDLVLLKHADEYRRYAWAIFGHAGGDGFYRPFGYLTLGWSERIAGRNPVPWHAISLALHLANCGLVFLAASALGWSRFAAALASALFALHGTRPEAVVWVAGRFDLLATFFALTALVLFLRGWLWIALAAMTLGMLSKESAYSIPLLLTIVAFGWKERWRALAPFWVVAAAMFGYRWWLLGGIGGYADAAGRLEIVSTGIIPILKTFALRLWAVLFFPVNWSFQPGFVTATLMAAYIVILVLCGRRAPSRRHIVIALGLLVAATLPTFHRLLIGAELENSRNLYLPSVGFALFMAAAADRLPKAWRWVAAAGMVLFSMAALEHNLSAWQFVARKADAACEAGASSVHSPSDRIAVVGLPRILNGVYFFQNGFPECVAIRAHIEPGNIVVSDRVPDQPGFSTVLLWNAATGELR